MELLTNLVQALVNQSSPQVWVFDVSVEWNACTCLREDWLNVYFGLVLFLLCLPPKWFGGRFRGFVLAQSDTGQIKCVF